MFLIELLIALSLILDNLSLNKESAAGQHINRKGGHPLASNIYTNFESLPCFLTVKQFSAVMGVGRNTAYNMVHSGQISHVLCGKQIRIPKEAVQNLVR